MIARLLALGGSATFSFIVIWLHFRRRDVRARTHGVSHYAVGPTRGAMTIAFAALDPLPCLGIVLMLLSALGIAVVAAVPVPPAGDRSWRGPLHTVGALAFFLCSASGAAAVARTLDHGSAVMSWALGAGVALFLAAMAGVPGLFSIRGWLQRLCFALVVIWTSLVASGPWP